MPIGSSLLDLTKAFYKVSHSVLCKKIEFYGLKNVALHFIVSYLSNRTRIVKINNFISSLKKATSGVPQGSVLGTFLFVVFVNDICVNVFLCCMLTTQRFLVLIMTKKHYK